MNKQEVYQFLQEKNIWFEITEHKAVYNMEEAAEIEKMRFEQWRAKQELELKKQMMAASDNENSNITVNIVRKTADD